MRGHESHFSQPITQRTNDVLTASRRKEWSRIKKWAKKRKHPPARISVWWIDVQNAGAKILFTIMTPAKPFAETADSFCTSRCLTRVQNGELLLRRKKHPEAVLEFPHHIQFMIKAYPQPLAKLVETHLEENSLLRPGYKCGDYGNGRYAVEYTHP